MLKHGVLNKLVLCFSCGISLLFMSAHCLAKSESALSDEVGEYLSDKDLPKRPKPLLEIGEKFLSTGNIRRGYTLATGAVWSPAFWLYGNYRSAYQTYETSADETVREWANRLDLWGNLQLSGTERVLIGLTPFHDRGQGEFLGKTFSPDGQKRTLNELNFEIDTLFFEGDFAELFPRLDYFDRSQNDIGFSIGRQRILFMDGFLINDSLDGFGLSKNNIRFQNQPNLVNWRSSIFVGLDGVHRNDNQEDDDSTLYAWFNQVDTPSRTYNIDLAYVDGEETGDLLNIAIDSTQRLGKLNTSFRAAASEAVGEATLQSDNGLLLFSELSWAPVGTHDNVYLNSFIAIDHFTSAARGPLEGGVLGRVGLLFAAQGIGTLPSALDNSAQDAAGFSIGYQHFLKGYRRQIIVEAGARFEGDDEKSNEYALGFRYQQAMGRRYLWQFDFYTTKPEGEDNFEHASRLELQVKL